MVLTSKDIITPNMRDPAYIAGINGTYTTDMPRQLFECPAFIAGITGNYTSSGEECDGLCPCI